jgi:hypothetical protein
MRLIEEKAVPKEGTEPLRFNSKFSQARMPCRSWGSYQLFQATCCQHACHSEGCWRAALHVRCCGRFRQVSTMVVLKIA